MIDTDGEEILLPCISYHLPSWDVCLFNPQACHQMHGGFGSINGNLVDKTTPTWQVQLPIQSDGMNLPVLCNNLLSHEEKQKIVFYLCLKLIMVGLKRIDTPSILATADLVI